MLSPAVIEPIDPLVESLKADDLGVGGLFLGRNEEVHVAVGIGVAESK
jgi:hypothetical protein